jgi:hypothetical protein
MHIPSSRSGSKLTIGKNGETPVKPSSQSPSSRVYRRFSVVRSCCVNEAIGNLRVQYSQFVFSFRSRCHAACPCLDNSWEELQDREPHQDLREASPFASGDGVVTESQASLAGVIGHVNFGPYSPPRFDGLLRICRSVRAALEPVLCRRVRPQLTYKRVKGLRSESGTIRIELLCRTLIRRPSLAARVQDIRFRGNINEIWDDDDEAQRGCRSQPREIHREPEH